MVSAPHAAYRRPSRVPSRLTSRALAHVTLAACIGLGPITAQQEVPDAPTLASDRQEGAATITKADLTAWLTELASDEFGGRATGTEGFRMAADFVQQHFESCGLAPGAADGTYLQQVPWGVVKPDAAGTWLRISKGETQVLNLTGDCGLGGSITAPSSGSGPLSLLLVRDLEEHGIGEMELEGRVVLLALHPSTVEAMPERRRPFATMFLGRVAASAVQAGAAAVVTVVQDGELSELAGGRAGGRNRALRGRGRMPNQLQIQQSVAAAALGLGGADPAVLRDEGEGTTRVDLNLNANVRVACAQEQAPAWNVIGVVKGSDPQLADEFVVIGSHLDHIGTRNGLINNGADDDGSGTVGVMAVARAFAKNGVRPRRSVLFVCFCGEENGLVGSRYFADNSPIPLESIVAELQMDMIGRNEEKRGESADENLNCLHLVGTEKISRDLHNLCMAKNESHAFAIEYDEENVFSRSDHASFAAKGIPIAFFFTGFHPDYHKPTDTVDKINFDKLRRIALYVYDIGFDLAMSDTRPLVDPDLWAANRRSVRGVEVPAAPVRKQ